MNQISTAIIAERTPMYLDINGCTSYNLKYRIVDKLFTNDIDDLYFSLLNYIEEEAHNINEITIDLSGSHDILFKPSRFFTVCKLIFNKLLSVSIDTTFKVIIGRSHSDIFENIEEEYNFPIIVKEISTSPIDIAESYSVLKWRKLAYWFAYSSMFIYILGIFYSLKEYYGTLFGFSLFFSSIFLFYESVLLIRHTKKGCEKP